MEYKTPYIETTNDIEIEVAPVYMEEESHPGKNQFIFMYAVKITNYRKKPITLHSRKWIINNGLRETNIVTGEGVIGETPTIAPGENYQYRSFCPLTTPTGNMRGTFYFEDENFESIEADIPLFFFRMVDRPGSEQGLYSSIS